LPEKPCFSPAAAAAIAREHYGLEVSAQPLPGIEDLNFHLQSETSEFVLKIHTGRDGVDLLEFQHQAMAVLADRMGGEFFPRPVADLAGREIGSIETVGNPALVRLLTWVPGIPLAQATLYVARAPKSNESVASLGRASALLHARPPDAIPAALCDAHYAGAKELGHGQGYLYSHDHPQASQVFLPAAIAGMRFTGDPVQKVDDEASSRLRAHLAASHAPGTWFEIDAGRLAAELNLPEPRVRQTLNELVKARLLAYKRSFKLTERDTP